MTFLCWEIVTSELMLRLQWVSSTFVYRDSGNMGCNICTRRSSWQ